MKTFWAIALVIVLGGGLFTLGYYLPGGGGDNQRARERCMYQAVERLPDLDGDATIRETVPACRDLPKSDQKKVEKLLIDFFEATFDRALVE